MGFKQRGVRTGKGPYKDSFRRTIEDKSIGRRKEAGEICLFEETTEKLEENTICKF